MSSTAPACILIRLASRPHMLYVVYVFAAPFLPSTSFTFRWWRLYKQKNLLFLPTQISGRKAPSHFQRNSTSRSNSNNYNQNRTASAVGTAATSGLEYLPFLLNLLAKTRWHFGPPLKTKTDDDTKRGWDQVVGGRGGRRSIHWPHDAWRLRPSCWSLKVGCNPGSEKLE